MNNMLIRPATPADAESVRAIYNHYVQNTAISFEEEPVSAPEMAARMAKVQAQPLPWLVATQGDSANTVCGYAYATPWRERRAYRFTVECSVYVAPAAVGTGVGAALYGPLFAQLKAQGAHAVVATIALPNAASTALHEKFGMQKVAHFREVGFKFDQWRDVGNWQRVL